MGIDDQQGKIAFCEKQCPMGSGDLGVGIIRQKCS
jgi:hypothetical protein